MQLAVISIFKSYPTVGDVALYLAFIPVWSHLHRCEFIIEDVVYVSFVVVINILFNYLSFCSLASPAFVTSGWTTVVLYSKDVHIILLSSPRLSSPLLSPTVLRNIFLVACVLLACSALFPVLWHLWIYAGSANSNFYYAITLLFNVAQVCWALYL